MKDEIAKFRAASDTWTPERVLEWGFSTFGANIAISSAFGAEGMVIIDMASKLRHGFRIFTLDTDFLFPETYRLMERVEKKYGVTIERVHPDLSPEQQQRLHGEALWLRDPDACCNLRKIEPLRRKLRELQAWITSIRRSQTEARAAAGKVEWDAKFGLVKLNPLADWHESQVWSYIRSHDVPYNPLHDSNYPSIGCTHCTRAVRPGEDSRAGRWAGFTKIECGLHLIQPASDSTNV